MRDLISERAEPYVIVGFFTPNYRELAQRFAENLRQFDQPYHLYAVPAQSSWAAATMMKPEIVLRGMKDYPGRTVILSDVDCILHGSLADMAEDGGDVTLHVRAWKRDFFRAYPYACVSSRLVAFQPTEKARELAGRWLEANKTLNSKNDETCLTIALARTIGLRLTTLPSVSGANETAFDRHPLVTHESAHTSVAGRRSRPVAKFIKKAKRAAFKALTGIDYEEWRYSGTRPTN